MPADAELLHVRVIYALPEKQISVELQVPRGTRVEDAVVRSGLMERFPEAARHPLACAVFGRAVPATHELREGDRVEILRPLLIDPKQSRREAADRTRTDRKSSRAAAKKPQQ